ncbi:MAG: glycosyltransferase family 2 protein [Xanthomonadales bacterium]
MKVIVQIPCFNEEATLPQTVADIPRQIEGVDTVEVLIIDDGSTDRTVEVAREIGVDHIVINKRNQGLAASFRNGLDMSLKLGADIVVNTDGDNQYAGWDIPKLIAPILDGTADIVIGDRQTDRIEHFSKGKKVLQKLGSGLVRSLSGTEVPDAVSGFRAYSRDAALQMNIVSSFSYTIETVIQAGTKQLAVTSVPVETNAKTRESRLFSSIPRFIQRQVDTIVRMYSMYKPLRVFLAIGILLVVIGSIPIARFLFFYFSGDGAGHVQSLILGGTLLILGFVTFLIGLLADLVGFNRRLIEIVLEKVRRLEIDRNDRN